MLPLAFCCCLLQLLFAALSCSAPQALCFVLLVALCCSFHSFLTPLESLRLASCCRTLAASLLSTRASGSCPSGPPVCLSLLPYISTFLMNALLLPAERHCFSTWGCVLTICSPTTACGLRTKHLHFPFVQERCNICQTFKLDLML